MSTKHKKKYPPISPGTKVKTTKENPATADSWSKDVKKSRQWNVEGEVIGHHDSHGLCYAVMHHDGSLGFYDPAELQVT